MGAKQGLVWSLSKTVLAAAVFGAIDSGRPTLDSRIAVVLPDLPVHPETIVSRLLRHMAEVPDYGARPGYHEVVRLRHDAPWSPGTYLDRASSIGPISPQGWQ